MPLPTFDSSSNRTRVRLRTTTLAPPSGTKFAWWQKSVAQSASTWSDQSGNANDLTQAVAADQPALSGGIYTFDGVNDFMATGVISLSQAWTLGIRLKQNSHIDFACITEGAGSGSRLQQTATDPQLQAFAGTAGLVDNTLAVGVWGSVVVVFNAASSVLRVGTNETTGNAGANGVASFVLGALAGGASNWASVSIAECIIYSAALNASDRATLQQYLDTK